MRIIYIAPIFLFAAVVVFFLAVSPSGVPSGPASSLDNPEGHPVQRTVNDELAVPLSTLYQPPQDMQDLVNRYDTVFTGTVAEISPQGPVKPYDWKPEDDALSRKYAIPLPRMAITYYTIRIEDVLLDDGNIRLHPQLGLTGAHSPARPQVGERFLFALKQQPDGLSYGLTADWCLIHLDGGVIRNFNGEAPRYAGVTGEATLKATVRAAVPGRVALPVEKWPIQQQWVADENTLPQIRNRPAAPSR